MKKERTSKLVIKNSPKEIVKGENEKETVKGQRSKSSGLGTKIQTAEGWRRKMLSEKRQKRTLSQE
jgi:hypothetical protein